MKKLNKASIQAFLKTDRAMLIICISIALIFWLLVKLSNSFVTEKKFAIDYNIPEGFTFVETPPKDLIATIAGVGWDLMYSYFSKEEPIIRFNLGETPSLTLNRTLLTNKVEEKLGSPQIQVTNINHDYILIQLEKEFQKKVPIILNVELSFAKQYQLKDTIQIYPDSVNITGPQSKIDDIPDWSTEKLILENIKADIERELPLKRSGDDQIRLGTNTIRVDIKAEQFTQKSLFLPIQVRNAPDSLNIFPSKIKLSAVVGLSKYGQLDAQDFLVAVDLKDATNNNKNNTVPIHLEKFPPFVRNITFSPKSVEFFIVK